MTEKQKRRQKVPAWGAAVGLKAHLSVCRDFLRQHPKAIALMLACGWISAASYLTFMFMQEHLIETGIPPFYIGIPLWIVQMTGTAGILIAARYRAGTVNFTGICAVCAGFGIILAGFKALHLSVAGFIVVEAANSAVNLQSMNVLNNMLPSDQRASLVSVQSLIYSSFMLAGSPVLGLICKTFGIAAGFTMTGGLLAASAVIMYVIYTKRLKKMTSLFRNADR